MTRHSPDDGVLPLLIPARQSVPDNAARRPTQDTLEPREVLQVQQPAIAPHELHTGAPQLAVAELLVETIEESIEVAPEDRREVRVGGGRDAAGHHLYHGQEPRGLGDVREPEGARELADRVLVVGEGVRVAEDDRE